MKKIFNTAFMYGILGLVLGVFYREFTKLNGFTGITQLSFLHVHTLVLGMFFLLMVLLLNKSFNLSEHKYFNLWFYLYNIGLLGTIGVMTTRGIFQVLQHNMNGLNHIAGLFHTILGVAIIWLVVILGKRLHQENLYSHS